MDNIKIILFSLFVWSCNESIDKNMDLFSTNNNQPLDSIVIDFSKSLKTSDLVDDIKIITLGEKYQILIGQVDKLLFSSDKMIIMDGITSKIFCFTLDGEYLYEVDQQGIGPGQYRELSDIAINYGLQLIEVLDRQGQNVLNFKLSTGEFVSSSPFLFFAATFANLNDSLRVFHTSNYPNEAFFENDEYAKTVYITDLKNEIRSKNFNFQKGLDKVSLVTKWNLFRSYNFKDLFYVPLYDNKVYKIGRNCFNLEYIVDFGEYTMPDSFLASYNGPASGWTKVIIESGYAFDLSNFIESKNFITFRSTVRGGPLYTIYDKSNKSSLSYELLSDDIGAFQIHPIAAIDDYFVTVVNRRSLNRKVGAIRSSSNASSKAFLDELERPLLSQSDEEFPVLVLVKLKQIKN